MCRLEQQLWEGRSPHPMRDLCRSRHFGSTVTPKEIDPLEDQQQAIAEGLCTMEGEPVDSITNLEILMSQVIEFADAYNQADPDLTEDQASQQLADTFQSYFSME
jgi:hypothetical protein